LEAAVIRTYSVAEARNRFAEILHDLEHVARIEVTRRGRPVAVLISMEEYERLCTAGTTFWDAYSAFREAFELAEKGVGPEVFEGLRDASPGREVNF
jgi:prevent-host-death family protein